MTGRIGAAAADPSVRGGSHPPPRPRTRPCAVVLTHTGRVFCAGADLKTAGSGSMTESATAIMAALTQIVRLPKPVIARITGHVRAGGIGIVGACDLAVADGGTSFASARHGSAWRPRSSR